MKPRPHGVARRDLLVGVLAVTAVQLKLHPALDIAADACEPLFDTYPPDIKRWYPLIDETHARAAIVYAGRALRFGAINESEYDWICDMARKAIMKPPRSESRVTILDTDRLRGRPQLLLSDHSGGDDAA